MAAIGLEFAMAASLLWTQRSASGLIRRATLVVLGVVAGAASLLLMMGVGLALWLGASGEATLLVTLALTLLGLLAFGRLSRWARITADDSLLGRWLFGHSRRRY